jgi:hypothetical protein
LLDGHLFLRTTECGTTNEAFGDTDGKGLMIIHEYRENDHASTSGSEFHKVAFFVIFVKPVPLAVSRVRRLYREKYEVP